MNIVDLTDRYRPGSYDNGLGNPCAGLVLHFTVSGSAPGTARNLAQAIVDETAGGATHWYVDARDAVLVMPEERKAWATGSALGHNNTTVSIEFCGVEASTWLVPDSDAGRTFDNACRIGAGVCRRHNITPRLLSIQQTQDVMADGITTHYRISIADGPGGSDHEDMSDRMLPVVAEAVRRIKAYMATSSPATADTSSLTDTTPTHPGVPEMQLTDLMSNPVAEWLRGVLFIQPRIPNSGKTFAETWRTTDLNVSQTVAQVAALRAESATQGQNIAAIMNHLGITPAATTPGPGSTTQS